MADRLFFKRKYVHLGFFVFSIEFVTGSMFFAIVINTPTGTFVPTVHALTPPCCTAVLHRDDIKTNDGEGIQKTFRDV